MGVNGRAGRSSFGSEVSQGMASALRRWPLALALYVPGLLLSLVATAPVLLGVDALGRMGPWAARLAEGDVGNVLFELTGGQQGLPPEVGAAFGGVLLGTAVLLLAVPLQGLMYNVLVGGVIDHLAGRSTGSFWSACRRWAGPMIRIGLAGFALFLLLAIAGLIVLAIVPLPGSISWWLEPLLAGLWLAVLNGLLETARAGMVAGEDPGAMRALGKAFSLLSRSGLVLPTLGLWLALGLASGAYAVVSAFGVSSVPANAPLAIFAVQQLFAFAGAIVKLVRLGAAVGVSRAAWPTAVPEQ
jgi:hypothetical protein